MEKLEEDRFYEYEPTEDPWCGACAAEALRKTVSGEFSDDEAMYVQDFRPLEDDDVEPYQCTNCNKQNEAYDNV